MSVLCLYLCRSKKVTIKRTDHAVFIMIDQTFPYYCDVFDTKTTTFPFQAEGLTAIECWVIACIIFVFGALLEYTVILLKLKLKKVQKDKEETRLIPVRAEQRTLCMCLMFCNLEANVPLCSFSVKTKVRTETSRQMNGFSSNGSSGNSNGLSRAGSKHKADR